MQESDKFTVGNLLEYKNDPSNFGIFTFSLYDDLVTRVVAKVPDGGLVLVLSSPGPGNFPPSGYANIKVFDLTSGIVAFICVRNRRGAVWGPGFRKVG